MSCDCGFLTSLFGLLALPCRLPLSDLWQSGANGTEPGFVSVVLWLDWCRLIGPLSSLSVSLPFPHLLPLDEVSDRVSWPVSDSAVDQHPHALTHSSSSPSSFRQRSQAAGMAGEPTHLQTRPPDLASPFIPFHPSYSLPGPFLTHTHIYSISPHDPSLCVATEDWGQAARQAGGLVCRTVLISTGVWRPKLRYLPPQPPSSKPLISLLFPLSSLPLSLSPFLPLSLSPCLWRLPPSYSLCRQVCEGCRCQLSFSWTTANLSLYLPSVVISSFIHISLFFFPPPSIYLLMNSVPGAGLCFPALSQCF